MRLAWELGRFRWEVLAMPADEFFYWQEFFRIHPWTYEREEKNDEGTRGMKCAHGVEGGSSYALGATNSTENDLAANIACPRRRRDRAAQNLSPMLAMKVRGSPYWNVPLR